MNNSRIILLFLLLPTTWVELPRGCWLMMDLEYLSMKMTLSPRRWNQLQGHLLLILPSCMALEPLSWKDMPKTPARNLVTTFFRFFIDYTWFCFPISEERIDINPNEIDLDEDDPQPCSSKEALKTTLTITQETHHLRRRYEPKTTAKQLILKPPSEDELKENFEKMSLTKGEKPGSAGSSKGSLKDKEKVNF